MVVCVELEWQFHMYLLLKLEFRHSPALSNMAEPFKMLDATKMMLPSIYLRLQFPVFVREKKVPYLKLTIYYCIILWRLLSSTPVLNVI